MQFAITLPVIQATISLICLCRNFATGNVNKTDLGKSKKGPKEKIMQKCDYCLGFAEMIDDPEYCECCLISSEETMTKPTDRNRRDAARANGSKCGRPKKQKQNKKNHQIRWASKHSPLVL